MENEDRAWLAHALAFPFPAQGHINPILQFCKRLVSKGVKATLVTTKYLSKSIHVDPSTYIDLQTISDGFDEGGPAQAESPEVYLSTFQAVGSQTLADLIKKLNASGHPVDSLIYDGSFPWALDVAKQLDVLKVVFITQSCAVSNVYYHVHKGLLQVPLSGPVVSVPGLPLLEVSETPSMIYDPSSYPAFYDVLINQFVNIDEADWVLHNSFRNMEEEVVDWMAKRWRLRTIGPTVPSMYLDKRIEDDKNYGINLFKPNSSACINWLHGKPIGSVVYVSFGSVVEPKVEQIREIAWGLRRSNCYFLWVIRASEMWKLPENFVEETSDEKGLVVTWCRQLEVLAHEAIGCFLTHCGFNSVLEALSLGVPMVAVPQWSDQPTNAKYVEDVWKMGIRGKPDEEGIVRREVVELCIREIMEGNKGKEIKENAKKWKKLSKEAIDEGGTSDQNIDEFVAALIRQTVL